MCSSFRIYGLDDPQRGVIDNQDDTRIAHSDEELSRFAVVHDHVRLAGQVGRTDDASVITIKGDQLAPVRGAEEPIPDKREAMGTGGRHAECVDGTQAPGVDDRDLRRLADVRVYPTSIAVVHSPSRAAWQRNRLDYPHVTKRYDRGAATLPIGSPRLNAKTCCRVVSWAMPFGRGPTSTRPIGDSSEQR